MSEYAVCMQLAEIHQGISTSAPLVLYLPSVFHTLVPKIRVCPEILHVFQYIDVVTCMTNNCQPS